MVCPLGLLGAHNLLMGLLATLAFPFQHAHFPEPLLLLSTSHHGNSGLWLTLHVHCTFQTEAITAVSLHHFLGSSLSVKSCVSEKTIPSQQTVHYPVSQPPLIKALRTQCYLSVLSCCAQGGLGTPYWGSSLPTSSAEYPGRFGQHNIMSPTVPIQAVYYLRIQTVISL